MAYDPDDPKTVRSWLSAYLGVEWNEYLSHWGLNKSSPNSFDDETREINQGLARLATAFLRGMHSLQLTDEARGLASGFVKGAGLESFVEGLSDAEIARMMRNAPVVRDGIKYELAMEAVDTLLSTAEDRAPELLAHLATRKLGLAATAYVERVTRLYLWGFDPECLAMCRATLEAALADRLYSVLPPDEQTPKLEQLLRLAGERSLLPGYGTLPKRSARDRGWRAARGTLLWKADRVRSLGNHVLHEEPALREDQEDPADIDTALRYFVDVIDRLFPPTHS